MALRSRASLLWASAWLLAMSLMLRRAAALLLLLLLLLSAAALR